MYTAHPRHWMPSAALDRERAILEQVAEFSPDQIESHLDALVSHNHSIYQDCVNLNPAGNVMNPRAEAALASGLSSHPSLGYPGVKYETGLEAAEEIEVVAADLAARVFNARFAEIRVGSGALANLYAFMATCRPGDTIITPSAQIGGHVTHHQAGAAGLYGLEIHHPATDADTFTVDLDDLAALAQRVRPRLISIGGSLNPYPHPVAEIKAIAESVGAVVLFDAAHVCGLIAGGALANPLQQGADLMTMSTYKSLGGPAGGLILTDDEVLAQRIDQIAYPGLTANFDVGTSASLAISLLDWIEFGQAYASAMVDTAGALADELSGRGFTVTPTTSHQFALDAARWGDGDRAAQRLRAANLLASGIGLPGRDGPAGLRLGTPEVVRWGMGTDDMAELAELVYDALYGEPTDVAPRATRFRHRFSAMRYVRV